MDRSQKLHFQGDELETPQGLLLCREYCRLFRPPKRLSGPLPLMLAAGGTRDEPSSVPAQTASEGQLVAATGCAYQPIVSRFYSNKLLISLQKLSHNDSRNCIELSWIGGSEDRCGGGRGGGGGRVGVDI